MSTPKSVPAIFLFTGIADNQYGYVDQFSDNGLFWYSGEGMTGDMEFKRSNHALRNHIHDGRSVFLFEVLGKGEVRFMSRVQYTGHHFEQRPDMTGALRNAIIFELALIHAAEDAQPVERDTKSQPYRYSKKRSLVELRALALAQAPVSAPKEYVRLITRN